MNITRTFDNLYMQFPPQIKKKKNNTQQHTTNVCAYTYMYTYPYTPHTHVAHTYTHPQHCIPAVTLSKASFLHLVLLSHHDYFNWTNSCAAMT